MPTRPTPSPDGQRSPDPRRLVAGRVGANGTVRANGTEKANGPATSAVRATFPSASPPAAASPHALRVAAIDVGSNSIHMIVAQVDGDGGVTTLWRMKEPVGLGRGSFPSHRLSAESIERAVNTLGRFKQAAIRHGAEKTVVVATSAVREAKNGGDLIERVRRELRLRVRVVTAKEEARLIYLGVRQAVDLGDEPHLLIDIGGGSVEFVVADGTAAALMESRKLGAARMTAQFVRNDPPTKEEIAALRRHYARELDPLFTQIRALQPVKALGTSGTLENLGAMCAGGGTRPGGHGPAIAAKPFAKLLERLIFSTAATRETIPGLDAGRRDQVIAGAVLVGEVFARLPVPRIHLVGAALREGILLDYIARNKPDLRIRREVPDPRRRAVIDLARRCDWHETHSTQVARLTLRLFDELRPLHGLGDVERELAEYAALLHDVGWHIARDRHHKHSQYLIEHGGLEKHFSAEEVGVLANVARYHRKAEPKPTHAAYAASSPAAQRTVNVLAGILRVADGLDRSHSSVVADLSARFGRKSVRVDLTTRADAALEVWGACRKRELLEASIARKIDVRG